MSQIYPSFMNAIGSANGDGSEVFGNGGKTVTSAAGITKLTLDQAADSTERSCIATIRGTTPGFINFEQVSDTVLAVHTYNTGGTSTNLAFDYVIFQKPGC